MTMFCFHRRQFFRVTAGGITCIFTNISADAAENAAFSTELRVFAGDSPVDLEDFGVDLPAIVESGYSVPFSVAPKSTRADPVEKLLLIAPLNPVIRVLALEFGQMFAGHISTRIRLARSQTVTTLAKTRSGRVLRQDKRVEVVVGGCGFDL